MVIDTAELLGKRMDFQIGLVRCLGIKWLKEGAERGIQMGYQPAPLNCVHTPPTPRALVGGSLSSNIKNEPIMKFS